MDKVFDIIKEIINKLSLKRLLFSVLIASSFVIVPRINFLDFVLPFDDIEKIFIFGFTILLIFFIIEALDLLFLKIIKPYWKKAQYKKKDLNYLEETIKILPDESKKILLDFIEANNKPVKMKEYMFERILIDNRLLCKVPYTQKNYADKSVYYKIDPHKYDKIYKLHKKKKILLTTNLSGEPN